MAVSEVYREGVELHEFAINAMVSNSSMTEMTSIFQTTFEELKTGRYRNGKHRLR